jgi:CheY-like chemotaxis protein
MKILLVDDSKSARYALRLQLQRHGVEVDTADSAETALELLKGELPDAVLMDHMMPGLNGLEALEAIRHDPRTAHLPVVMCTSQEDEEFAATAERKGVAGILPKSGAPEKLPAILAKLRDTIRIPSQATLDAGVSAPPPVSTPAQSRQQVAAAPSSRTTPAPPPGASGLDEAQILARLDERIATRLTGLLDDLRRDLSERLTAEVHRQIDSGLEAQRQELDRRLQDQIRGVDVHLQAQQRGLEQQLDHMAQSQGSSLAQSNRVELLALAEEVGKQMLPSLVKVEIEAERGQIMELVEQYLRQLAPRLDAGRGVTEERLATLNEAIAGKAAEVARREARTAVETAVSRLEPKTQPPGQPRLRLTGVYLAALAAALTGIGAAAAVYILLS